MTGLRIGQAGVCAAVLAWLCVTPAGAEIDNHGPDAWRVTGVDANDHLNARMGPGTGFPVIDSFAHDETGMEEITCVPLLVGQRATEISLDPKTTLPPRWCLMRSGDLARAGWVNAAYLMPDYSDAEPPAAPGETSGGNDLVAYSEDLVRRLYDLRAEGDDSALFTPEGAGRFFFTGVDAQFLSGEVGADPIFGAQDFEGHCDAPRRDPENPMFRGMITVIVDCVNFGQPQRAEYSLRVDPDSADRMPRIFRISHDGWSFPE